MPKRKLLNVRDHLEHCELIFDTFKKYGDCPAVREAVAQASLIGRAIMRKHDEALAEGKRKDIYLNRAQLIAKKLSDEADPNDKGLEI